MSTKQADKIDERQLLKSLRAFRKGDFSVRLPTDQTGIAGEIAEAFNINRDNPQGSSLNKTSTGPAAEIDNALTNEERAQKQRTIFDMGVSIVNNPTAPKESRLAAAKTLLTNSKDWASTLVPGTDRKAYVAQLRSITDPKFQKNIAEIASAALTHTHSRPSGVALRSPILN